MDQNGSPFPEEDFPELLPAVPVADSNVTKVKEKKIATDLMVPSAALRDDSLESASSNSMLTTKRTKKMGLFDIMNIQASRQSKKSITGNDKSSSTKIMKGATNEIQKSQLVAKYKADPTKKMIHKKSKHKKMQ